MSIVELLRALYRTAPGLFTVLVIVAFVIGICFGYQIIGPHLTHRP